MDGAFDRAAIGRLAAAALRIEGAAHERNFPVRPPFDADAADDARVPQPHFLAGGQAVEAGRRFQLEIVAVDVDPAREGQGPRAFFRHVVRPVGRVEIFDFPFRVVFEHHLERPQHAEHPRRAGIEVFADAVFEQADVDDVVGAGHADPFGEVADRFRGITAAAQTREGGHAGIVPAGDVAFFHQLEQFAFAHHGVVEVEAGKLDLPWLRRDFGFAHHPVVKLAVVLELECTQRVGDVFDGIRERVREVVHRVDAPGIARAVVVRLFDAVEQRVAHLHVGRGHVDFGAQHQRAGFELTGPHAGKKIEVLLHAAVPEGAVFALFGERAAVLAHLLLGQLADVSLAAADQHLGELVELLEVVRGVVEVFPPFETEPAHVGHDGIDVFGVFGGGVGVVEA